MASETTEETPRSGDRATLIGKALAALPIAVEIRAASGERVYANPAAEAPRDPSNGPISSVCVGVIVRGRHDKLVVFALQDIKRLAVFVVDVEEPVFFPPH